MTDQPRLIERAFPLKQASLDSVHEKNVRHGHISTLHIWPARRPLAACRAALIATLLPDPGNPEERKRILEKLGGSGFRTRSGVTTLAASPSPFVEVWRHLSSTTGSGPPCYPCVRGSWSRPPTTGIGTASPSASRESTWQS